MQDYVIKTWEKFQQLILDETIPKNSRLVLYADTSGCIEFRIANHQPRIPNTIRPTSSGPPQIYKLADCYEGDVFINQSILDKVNELIIGAEHG